MAVIDDFKTRFPAFDSVTVDAVLPPLVDTVCCYWGGGYDGCGKEITLQLLAHLFVLDTATPSSGLGGVNAVASKSVGSVSVSYNVASTSGQMDSFFSTTRYGQRFLMLTAHGGGGVFV